MQRIVKFLCVGSLLVFLFPLNVYADDNSTYTVYEANTCVIAGQSSNYWRQFSANKNLRAVTLLQYNTLFTYFVSNETFYYNSSTSNSTPPDSCNVPSTITSNPSTKTLNGTTYYFYGVGFGNPSSYSTPYAPITIDNSADQQTMAIYYTFGEGAVDPIEPLNWGDLLDVKFNTSIAGSGSAATNNIDQITWDPVQDSNGNALTSEQRVEIKAIAGNYNASSRNGLFGLGATDFDYNSGVEHLIGNVAANRGEFHIQWSEVIRQLNDGSISDFLNIRKSDDVWLKSGWIYQYRFVADDYTGSWHTIYNGTSAGVQNSINIEQSTQINTNLVNTIVEINTLNNSEQQNWMINNTVINMENSDGQETTDKPWWAYLLEAIVSLIDGVLTFLGNLIGDLISAIIDLFTFDSFDLDVIVDFGTEQKESNNIIGQSINFFDNVVQSAQSMRESDVIISYPGITLFEVELLPAADYNLNDYVDDLGLTDFHNLAYLVTDGSIAICLISLVYRKIMGILRS